MNTKKQTFAGHKSWRDIARTLVFALLCCGISEAAMACTDVFGGAYSYNLLGSNITLSMTNITNISDSTTTGTLRLELWMFSSPYTFGSGQNGWKVAEYSVGQLSPNSNFPSVDQTVSVLSVPPDGDYYVYYLLTEYDPNSCSANDGFCVEWFSGFSNLQVVSGGVYNGNTSGGGDANSGPSECTINNNTTGGTSGNSSSGGGAFGALLLPLLGVMLLARKRRALHPIALLTLVAVLSGFGDISGVTYTAITASAQSFAVAGLPPALPFASETSRRSANV